VADASATDQRASLVLNESTGESLVPVYQRSSAGNSASLSLARENDVTAGATSATATAIVNAAPPDGITSQQLVRSLLDDTAPHITPAARSGALAWSGGVQFTPSGRSVGGGSVASIRIECVHGLFGACSAASMSSAAFVPMLAAADHGQRPGPGPEGQAPPEASGSPTSVPATPGGMSGNGSIGNGGSGPGGAALAVAALLILAAWFALDQLALLIPTGIVLSNRTPPR